VVEKGHLISGQQISEGDVIVGIGSSGFHSNGYSLIRKAVFGAGGLNVQDHVDELGMTVGQALMTPTLIYANLTRSVLSHYKVKNVVHGIAHITGGGLLENSQRILHPKVDLVFERGSWEVPKMFSWVQKLGQIDSDEMDNVFNMGLGLVLVVSPYYVNTIMELAQSLGYRSSVVGSVSAGTGKSRWK
jgi:phosphoribosylformylglycinamidine cyclo-ligase